MEAITVNPNRIDLDEAYLQMAEVWARRSKANRLQVGSLIVKDKQIISDGYNGMPAGSADDTCEMWYHDPNDERSGGSPAPVLRTKREVLHAESNALMKIAENGGTGAQGATIYTTWSPCFECAKLIRQAKIARVVFRSQYRDMDGVKFLIESGVEVVQLHGDEAAPRPVPVVTPQAPQQMPKPLSMLQAVTGTDSQVARLRAAQAAPPTVEEAVPETVPEVIVGQTDFKPIVSEDEVMALLRAHEAEVRGAAQPPATKQQPVADGPYQSSFL